MSDTDNELESTRKAFELQTANRQVLERGREIARLSKECDELRHVTDCARDLLRHHQKFSPRDNQAEHAKRERFLYGNLEHALATLDVPDTKEQL